MSHLPVGHKLVPDDCFEVLITVRLGKLIQFYRRLLWLLVSRGGEGSLLVVNVNVRPIIIVCGAVALLCRQRLGRPVRS